MWRTIAAAAVGADVADIANLPRKQIPKRVSCYQQIVTFGVRHADLYQVPTSVMCSRSDDDDSAQNTAFDTLLC